MIAFLQILFVLLLIVLIVLLVFKTRRPALPALPDHYRDLLQDYLPLYAAMGEDERERFEKKLQQFFSSVKITGVNAEVEDLDRVLVGAAALIPVYHIPDWEYVNLHEVLIYPGRFNTDFDQQGGDRSITGMVGTGALQNVMILSKWELRQGFINRQDNHNTAIHEFVHLIDKMDGTLDGVPELLLEKRFVAGWKDLMETTMQSIRNGQSDINPYAATSPVECFAVVAEYYFEQPAVLQQHHPALFATLQRIFVKPTAD